MSCFIRLRGLPWSVTHREILDFLQNVNVVNGTKGIHMVLSRWEGKNTGEAFVELESEEDEKEAFKLNKNTIGHRYIEATNEEAEHALKNPGSIASNVVKLRGLPYAITDQMIEEFFSGLNLKRNGILICMDKRGRATGEAYVQFENVSETEQALLRNREKIGHRYIEIFRSSLAEMRRQSNNRPAPYDAKFRGGGFRQNRDDFGGNMNNSRDTGFGNDDKNGFMGGGGGGGGGGNNKPMGMDNSGNGLNLNGFGMFSVLYGFNNGNNSGDNFDRPMNNNNNNMGMNNYPSIGGSGNMREQNMNQGQFWNNNDMNKNMRGLNKNMNQSFDDNRGFNNDNIGKNNDNAFRGFNKMNMGGGMGGNNMIKNKFGNNNRDFQNDNNLFCIHMRGLPYNTFENEVLKFFQPLRPENIKIIFNNKGLHSGSADVFFSSYNDSQLAMKKHMEQIGSRYIELFFDGKAKGKRNSFSLQNNQNF